MLRKSNQVKQDDTQSFEIYNRAINELPPIQPKKASRLNKTAVTMFATFMASAIIVGSLAYAADYYHVFSQGTAAHTTLNNTNKSVNAMQAAHQSSKQSTSSMYELASQAVVKVENYSQTNTNSIYNDPRLQMFFSDGQLNQQQDSQSQLEEMPQDSKQQSTNGVQTDDISQYELAGTGTGYIFEAEGYILTNEHVIHGADYVAVTVPGYDEPFKARVVSASTDDDIAVLKIESEDKSSFAAIPLGDSDKLGVGEWVMAIGNPYGYDYTLTMGIISAKERPITLENSEGEEQEFEHMLQTDASINPGNSGGPLLNEQGEVIGMNTAVNSEAQGMGFAIPINDIKAYLATVTLS